MIRITKQPDIQSAVLVLSTYTTDGLKSLIENEEQMETYIQNLPQCQELVAQKDLLMAQNKSLAEYNLKMEPTLERGKANLIELCSQCEEMYQRVEEKMKMLSGSISTDTALSLLQASAAESEDDSEKLVEILNQKEIEIEEFLDRFQEYRKRMHLRKLKADKMKELLNEQKSQKRSSIGKSHTRPAPPPPTSALPYPVPGITIAMPMPPAFNF